MKVAAIIYSRLGSKRLKNKALIKLDQNTLLDHVILNTKKIKSLNKIVLATTTLKNDKKLVNVAKKHKIDFFQGNNKNVLKRTVDCLEKKNIDFFLRVCGDRVFFDSQKIDQIIKKIKKKKLYFDLLSSNIKKKVDEGLTIEIIATKGLKKILKLNKKITNYDKEHITNNFYKFKNKYLLKEINLPNYFFLNLKYTIDDKIDVLRTKYILKNLKIKNFSQIVKNNFYWKKNEKKNV